MAPRRRDSCGDLPPTPSADAELWLGVRLQAGSLAVTGGGDDRMDEREPIAVLCSPPSASDLDGSPAVAGCNSGGRSLALFPLSRSWSWACLPLDFAPYSSASLMLLLHSTGEHCVFTSCGEERPPASLLLRQLSCQKPEKKKKTHGRPGKLPIREHAVPSDGTRKTWHQLRCLKLTFVQTKQYYTILVPKIAVQYCILCL